MYRVNPNPNPHHLNLGLTRSVVFGTSGLVPARRQRVTTIRRCIGFMCLIRGASLNRTSERGPMNRI